MTWNYFAVFDAMLPRIGMLRPEVADKAVAFYVNAKSATEMLMERPGEPRSLHPIRETLPYLRAQLRMLEYVLQLGDEFGRLRKRHILSRAAWIGQPAD